MSFRVFVSYSRRDLALIQPVVGLLRATRDMVFHDVDSLRAGEPWRSQWEQALSESSILLVFWCRHAARSKHVRWEYEFAIERGKSVLPLLVDSTPLPPGLSDYQYIDFRQVFGSMHSRSSFRAIVSAGWRRTKIAVFLLLLAYVLMQTMQFVAPVFLPIPVLLLAIGGIQFVTRRAALRRKQRRIVETLRRVLEEKQAAATHARPIIAIESR